MKPSRCVAAAVLALALALAGCSSGGDEAASTTTAAPTTLTRPTSSSQTVDTAFSGQNSADFCNLSKTFNDRFASFSTNATPAQLRSTLGEARNALNQAATVAPSEIKADMQVIAAAFAELVGALDKVNYDANKLDPATFRKLQEPQFVTASQRLQAYLTNICKA